MWDLGALSADIKSTTVQIHPFYENYSHLIQEKLTVLDVPNHAKTTTRTKYTMDLLNCISGGEPDWSKSISKRAELAAYQ
jgi:hypothetical protein